MNVIALSKSSNFNEKVENKRKKIRKKAYDQIYKNKSVSSIDEYDNPRLRFRFAEAIAEAHEKCAESSTDECFSAWDEVDELEDSMMRFGLNLFPDYYMRYGSLIRRNFKIRWNVRNIEDHHVIPVQFRYHKIFDKISYDLQASNNLIMLPRDIGNLRKNRVTHNGSHPKYNIFVGMVLDSMLNMEEPEPEFKEFVNFLKIGCRFRPQDIPWN